MFAHLKNSTSLLLIGILLIGGILRFAGVNPGFNQYHSDEGISYSAATSMILNGNLDPLRYDYPALVPEINYLSFRLFFIPVSWTKYYLSHAQQIIDGYEKLIPTKEDSVRIFHHDILGDREIHALFWGRYTTAFISTLSIVLIYLLGTRLVNKKVGLIAAFLLAINFRSVTNSHIGLPDTYNAFFLLLSLLLSFRLTVSRSKINYILAGIGIGLSLAVKYQTFVVFPFLVMHFCSTEKWYFFRNILKASFDKKLYIAGFTAIAVFILLNPYFIIHFEQAFTWVRSVSQKYAMGRDNLNLFPLHYWLFIDYGFLLFSSICFGFIVFVKKYRLSAMFLLAEIVPFLFVMLYYSIGGFYVRNFITITPLFILFASYFLYQIYRFCESRKFLTFCFLIILVLVSYTSVQNVTTHAMHYIRPWNYQSILTIADKAIPDGSVVVGHPFDPLPQEKKINRIPISTKELYSLSEIQNIGADFAYINLDWAADPFYGWMTRTFPQNIPYILHKPYSEMRQTFWGLSIEEMMHFVVGDVYKPWQAPEADLFIIKVPHFGEQKYTIVKDTAFSSSYQWTKVNENDSAQNFLLFSPDKNVLQIGPGSGIFNISKFESERFSALEGHLYKISVDMSSNQDIPSNARNVFITSTYFDSKKQSLFTAVSPRFFGSKKTLSLVSQAPEGAKSMIISIQATDALQEPVYIHHVRIEQSEAQLPFVSTGTIPLSEYKDLLYPNSHGNL